MEIILLTVFSLLPAAILLIFFEKQDKGRKEPKKLMWKIFRWGIMATVFAIIIEVLLEKTLILRASGNFWLYNFLSAFVTAALVEESLKMWIVKNFVYKNKHFDEIMDGITYTIIASLGFATIENLVYVWSGGFTVAALRAFLSVPGHALFSGVMGYYIGKSRFVQDIKLQNRLLYKGLFFAILYHGLFNFFLFAANGFSLLVIPLMVTMGIHLMTLIRQARFEDKVDKLQPEKLTFQKVLGIIGGTLFIIFGSGVLIGMALYYDETGMLYYSSIYVTIGALILSLLFLWLGYCRLKKY